MAKTKGVRLFKVLRELNVARATLLEHLNAEGLELDGSGPNARLSDEVYAFVLKAFSEEREAAERHAKRVKELRRDNVEDGESPYDFSATLGPTLPPQVEREEAPSLPKTDGKEADSVGDDTSDTTSSVAPQTEETAATAREIGIENGLPEIPEGDSQAEEKTETPSTKATEAEAEPELDVAEPVHTSEDDPDVKTSAAETSDQTSVDEATAVDETPVAAEPEPKPELKVDEPSESSETSPESAGESPDGDPASVETATEAGKGDTKEPEALIKAGRYTLSRPRVLGKVDLGVVRETEAGKPKRKRRRKKKGDGATDSPPKPSTQTASADSKRQRKKKGARVDKGQVDQAVQDTLRNIEQSTSRVRQRRRRQRREEHAAQRDRDMVEAEEDSKVLRITEFITASELAAGMNVQVTEIIKVCMELGTIVSINQRLDADAITLIADEFEYDVDFIKEIGGEDLIIEDDDPADLQPRSPVVTVMGHVDHGKTSLLDFIRSANVVGGESGGITQHIGAYVVELPNGRTLTFLDTPGHEAFTAMRARGAQVTDAVILVVAADDSVMPQTIEAINHAKAAEVPIIVAINKIDKEGANTDKVMQGLADENVLVEQYGGKVQAALVSAITGEGIDDLLDKVLLETDLIELTANPNRGGIGSVIESRVDKGRGVVTTVLVQNGTIKQGDTFVVGAHYGRVRAMFDEHEERIETAGPSQPTQILGLSGMPEVGDRFIILEDEREAREIAQNRQQIQRQQSLRMRKHITLEDVGRRLALGDIQVLNIIVKADVSGSVEALTDALLQLSDEEVQVAIIHSGVGAITEGDVMLASASDAVILGFQVRPIPGVKAVAEREEIDIRMYSIIYDAISDVRDALEGMLSPEVTDNTLGMAEVRELFRLPKRGVIAGCHVIEGKIRRNDKVRLVRDGVVIYDGELGSLRRFKEDVKEVASGYECGLSIAKYQDVKVSDIIEAYELIETRRQLQS